MALNPDGGTDPLPPVDDPPLPTPPIPPKNLPPNVNSVRSPSDGVIEVGGRLWMRKWALSIGPAQGGKAEDLSNYDFEFTIAQEISPRPAEARIKIWNLSQEIIARMEKKELQNIVLWAGYQAPSKQWGSLFAGQVGYYKNGRQNATDTFLEIFALTYDTAINATIVNEWLKAGHTTKDAVQACVDAMSPHGVSLGTIPEHMSKDAAPRGRLLWGNVRDYCRDIARTANGTGFVDKNGKYHILSKEELAAFGKERVVILNVDTGMVDVPIRTMDGAVEVTSLLNPAIVPGSKIRIHNEDTVAFKNGNSDLLVDANKRLQEGSLAFRSKGDYPVLSVRHQGQTRGNMWHSQVVCETALPPAQPPPPTTLGG